MILVLSSGWLSRHYFKTPYATNIVYIFCVYLVADGLLAAINTFFTGLQLEKYYSSTNLFRQAMILGFSVLFIFLDKPSIINYAFAWAISCIVTTAFYYILFRIKHKKYIKTLTWDKEQFSTMAKYAVPTLLTISVSTIIAQSDVLLLTSIKTVREVGIYNIILPIVTIPNIFLSPINKMIFPLVSDLMEDNKEKVKILINSIIKIIPFIGFYFSIFILLFPEASITNLFGKRWVDLARLPLTILAVGFVANLLTTFLSTITTAMGKVNQKLRISVIIAVFNLIAGGIMVYYYGIVGLVIANSLIYILSVVLYGNLIKKEVNYYYPWSFYLKTFVLGTFLYITVQSLGLDPSGWVEFIVYGLAYTAVFAIFGYIFGVVDKSIINEARNLLTRSD
jgi:O-antigen/teichoic acid export membrane protein